jgi:thiol-disulfide isomerase/thioredoxin
MTHRGKNFLLVLCLLPAVLGWALFPGTFAHGVIVGVVGALVLLLGALIVFAQIMRKRIGTHLKPPPLPVESWDYVLDGQDLAGTPVPFSRYSGRVLVLNFWATWCGPCLAEMPGLQRLLAATSDLKVAFACLTQEKPDAVRKFVEKRGLTLPIFLFQGDPPACFRSRAVPATFILDKAGRIVMRHVGAAQWDDPSIVAFVRGLATSLT